MGPPATVIFCTCKVLAEIEKMKETIAKEGAADKENFDWCKKERKNSDLAIKIRAMLSVRLGQRGGGARLTLHWPKWCFRSFMGWVSHKMEWPSLCLDVPSPVRTLVGDGVRL